jgi:pimeloyl-ACP methyl ester carboxylesterase
MTPEETKESWVRRAGVSLYVRDHPSAGGDVVLLHGLASTSRFFDLLIAHLTPDYRAAAFDQRGHGLSDKPRGQYSFDECADDVAAVTEALEMDLPLMVGHSWGAAVVLEAATRYPQRLCGAVLIDGGFMSLSERMSWEEASRRLAPPEIDGMEAETLLTAIRARLDGVVRFGKRHEEAVMSLFDVDSEGRIRRRLPVAHHLEILRQLWGQDTFGLLAGMRVPTLVLAARRPHPPPEEAEFQAAKRRGAERVEALGDPVRFEWIEGLHDVPFHRPRAVANRIRAFALSVGVQPASSARRKAP